MSGALWFRSLDVRRMPGFSRGGLRLKDLSPGINLIHGPNASGKTTAAKALQAALWSAAAPENASVEARFELDGADWLVDVDNRRVLWQRDGQDASAPPLPPAGTRDRYRLSLHELLTADDGDLAERIRVESAGGYDVPAAAAVLEFGAGAGRPRNLLTALENAERALADARQHESELLAARQALSELTDRHARLREQAAAAEPLRLALELARARKESAKAARALDAFDAGVARLDGTELGRLDEWATARETAARTIVEADRAEESAANELEAADLGEDGLPGSVLQEVEERLDRLRKLDDEVARARETLARARAEREYAGNALGFAVGEAPFPEPSAADADRLEAFIRRAQALLERRAALDERLGWLAPDRGRDEAHAAAGGVAAPDSSGGATDRNADDPHVGAPGGADTREARPDAGDVGEDANLHEAARILRAWLRASGAEGPAGQRLRRLLLAAILILGLLGIAAYVLGRPGLAVAAIAAAFALALLRPGAAANARADLEKQARRLGHEPASWTDDDVESALDALERRLAEAGVAELNRQEAARLERQRPALEREEAELAAERQRIAADLGIAPAPSGLALDLTAMRLRTWTDARAEEEAASAIIEARETEREDVLKAAGDGIGPYAAEPTDAEALAATLKDLRERRERHTAAVSARDAARANRKRAEAELTELEEKRTKLFERVELVPDQELVLRAWNDQLEPYRVAVREADVARRRHDEAEAAFDVLAHADAARTEALAAVRDMPVEELEEARRLASEAAEEAQNLADRITEIRTRIGDARKKHDVEEALARVADARAALRDERDTQMEAAIGEAVVAWLRDRASEQGRPAVFHRARELFAEISRHRYQLDLADDDGSFRAYDAVTERGYALDELSSGTRIQLLLAVRVAFVETQESGAAPPLLLDEVLANSDDDRAAAIIDAAIALARAGRQVFYFTAQPDEIGKWRNALEANREVDWCARTVDGAAGVEGILEWPAPERPSLPAPDGRTHDEYGRALDVPRFDPWADGIGGLHLWHLVEDVQALYGVLDQGITRWGQLDRYARHLDGAAGGESREVVRRARRAAAICERFRQLWRHGRGRPVDRSALSESGAVSNTFIDRVADLCEEVDGDAAAIIDGLEANRVARFQTAKIDELRAFFLEHGYLSEDRPHDPDEIRLMLPAEAAGLAPDLGPEEIDRLIRRLAHGPEVPDAAGTSAMEAG